MKKLLILVVIIASAFGGFLAGKGHLPAMFGQPSEVPSASKSNQGPEILYWVAPMDANYRRDKPGKSPMGMDLVPVYAGDGSAEKNSVTIEPAIVQSLGVRSTSARLANWQPTITAVGEVRWDQSQLTKIYARAEGWLESFQLTTPGQRVAADATLYGLYAPQLVTAQGEYLQALRSQNSGLIASSRNRLIALGVNKEQIRQLRQRRKVQRLLSQSAEDDSIVLSVSAAQGSYVTPSTEIATLVGTSKVWVEAEFNESDASLVKVGDAVEVRFNAYPNNSRSGQVDYIYPSVNPRTRSIKLRVILENKDQQLTQGLFASITVQGRGRKVLLIPSAAVIRAGSGNRVVTRQDGGRFAVKPILTGADNGDSIEVIEGLKAGDTVVTSGQFLLDAEANGFQALERLTALKSATVTGSVMGFPRRGKIRILHDPVPSLDWPAMNMVFSLAKGVNIMPINKQDTVIFEMRETLTGDWQITAIEKQTASSATGKEPRKQTSEAASRAASHTGHQGMNHE